MLLFLLPNFQECKTNVIAIRAGELLCMSTTIDSEGDETAVTPLWEGHCGRGIVGGALTISTHLRVTTFVGGALTISTHLRVTTFVGGALTISTHLPRTYA